MAQSINLPLAFLSDANFKTFQYRAREQEAPLLGRLIVLAASVLCLSRFRFSVDEVEAIVSWDGYATFSGHLVEQGWAEYVNSACTELDIKLPAALKTVKRQTLAGKVRAFGAVRDRKGRYLRSENSEPPAYPKRPALTVDSEGNVMFDSLSGVAS